MTKTLQERKAEAREVYYEARKSWNEAWEAYEVICKEIEKEGE